MIIFFEDYAHSGITSINHLKNHYVASTRARNKIILVSTSHVDAGALRGRLKELFSHIEMKDIISTTPKTIKDS